MRVVLSAVRRGLVCALAMLGAAPPLSALEKVVDEELLQLLLAAQETNLNAFDRGRMRVHFEQETAGERIIRVDGVFTWQGPNVHQRYTREVRVAGVVQELQEDGRIIETPRERLGYQPRHNYAGRTPPRDRLRYTRDEFRLLPREAWFHTRLSESRSWREMLEPDFAATSAVRYSLTRISPTQVEMRREHHDGTTLACRFDLTLGGNAVFCDRVEKGGLPSRLKTTWSWLPDGQGLFRLNEFTHRQEGLDGELIVSQFLKVLEFDPAPDIPADLFTLKGLEITTPGVILVDETTPTPKRIVLGKADQDLIREAEMKRLAEELRKEGFSARSREQ
jgi:hypothetical protein